MKAKKKCHKLILTEVSNVAVGANQFADMVLTKNGSCDSDAMIGESEIETDEELNEGVLKMTLEELQKALEQAQADQKTAEDKLAKSEAQAKEDVAKAKAAQEAAEAKAAEVAKENVSSAVEKQLEAVVKQNLEMAQILKAQQEVLELNAFAKRANAELPNLPGDETQKAQLLKAVSNLGDSDKEYALQVLKSANEALSSAFQEVGKANVEKKAPEDRLKAMAKEINEKNPSLTFEQAYTKALTSEEGMKIYDKLNPVV